MRKGIICLVVCCFGMPTIMVGQGLNTSATIGSYLEKQIATIKQLETHLQPNAYYELANTLSDQQTTHFSLEDALKYANLAYKRWNRLDKKEVKRAQKTGISTQKIKKLKGKIRDLTIAATLQKNTLKAFDQLVDLYPKLPGEIQEKITRQRNQLVMDSAIYLKDHLALNELYKKHQYDIEYYNPDFKKAFDSLIIQRFFEKYEDYELFNVLYFIKSYPTLASKMDDQLSKAFRLKPFVEITELYLKPFRPMVFPKTSKAIYEYYALSAESQDLLDFGTKYPDFTQNDRYLLDVKQAKEGYFKLVSEFDDHYVDYIELMDSKPAAFPVLQRLIKKELEAEDWEAALQKIIPLASYFEKEPRYHELVNLLQQKVEPLEAKPLENNVINTILEEYAPVISFDGNTLFFCRRLFGKENIYTAQKTKDGWSKPTPIQSLNEDDRNDAPIAIAPDGSMLLIFEEGVLKITEKTKDGWSAPRTFFPEKLQSEWQGGTTLSADKNTVIFAARRPDRVGLPKETNIDLYFSTKKEDGSWSYPKNLGTQINTPFEERSPFLHPDLKTLYFSSSGHGGFGDLDVFKTTRIGEGWDQWSEPENLGKYINTPEKDWGYKVTTDGLTTYFSKEVPSLQDEIYQIELPGKFRPTEVSTIEGRLTDLDNQPIDGVLIIEDLENGRIVNEITPNPTDGQFFLPLPPGKLYSYTVVSSNHFPISGHIDLRKTDHAIHKKPILKTPSIKKLTENGWDMTLENLFFEHDKAIIQPASFKSLDQLGSFLVKHGLSIEIAGHTDNTGAANYNLDLSERRAKSVANYLVNQGCNRALIKTRGYGMSQPIASNEDESGRALNRRVAIRFLPTHK